MFNIVICVIRYKYNYYPITDLVYCVSYCVTITRGRKGQYTASILYTFSIYISAEKRNQTCLCVRNSIRIDNIVNVSTN